MHRTTALALSALALLTLLGGTAVATGNQPPLADAGLDQSVERGATVQLDTDGSRDPDGTVASVAWVIEAPDGTTRTPDCPSCVQTTFSPTDVGRYDVTVTVTDDAGVSRSDTLHVEVVASGGPTVSVTAPPAVPPESQRNLTADVSAGDADLRTLGWVVNGTAVDQTRLDGTNSSVTIAHTFDGGGAVPVRAVVYDAAGRRGVDTQTVQVASASGGGGSGGGSCPGGSGSWYVDGQDVGCTSSAIQIGDTFVDGDGKPGLWSYVDGQHTQLIKEGNLEKYSRNGRGDTFSKSVIKDRKNDVRTEMVNEQFSRPNDAVGGGDKSTTSSGPTSGYSISDHNTLAGSDSSDEDWGGYSAGTSYTGTSGSSTDSRASTDYGSITRDRSGSATSGSSDSSSSSSSSSSSDSGGGVSSGDFGGAFDSFL